MSKTLPGWETIVVLPAVEIDGQPWIAHPTLGLIDFFDVTSDVLNTFIETTKPSDPYAAQGGNVSKVILDNLNLGLASSDTDGDKTVTSKGNSEELTFYNFNAELNARRDEDIAGDSTENLFRDLTRAPDVPQVIAHRVRGQYSHLDAAVANQEWDFYFVYTDVQVPGYGDNENQQAQASYIPKNIVLTKHNLTA